MEYWNLRQCVLLLGILIGAFAFFVQTSDLVTFPGIPALIGTLHDALINFLFNKILHFNALPIEYLIVRLFLPGK